MNIIVFAPESHMGQVVGDLAAVANAVPGTKLITGAIDTARVFDELAGDTWDVVWFSSHLDSGGIALTGERLSGRVLASALRGTSVQLVFINTCASEQEAEQLYAATSIPVICTIGPIEAPSASGTANRFARLLGQGKPVAAAFALARNQHFRLIPDTLTMPEPQADYATLRLQITTLAATLQEQGANIERQEKLLQVLDEIVRGGVRQDGLMHEFRKFNARLTTVTVALWVLVLLFTATLGTIVTIMLTLWSAPL